MGAEGEQTIQVHLCLIEGGGEVDAALLLLAEGDARRLLVQADAEAFQLMLDQPLMAHGLQAIQDDENEVASAGSANDLQQPALLLSTWLQ